MKAERVKTPATTEEVSSHPGETGLGAQKSIETPLAPQKTRRETWENYLQTYEAGRK